MVKDEKLKLFLKLWEGENSIKTAKLQNFFIFQAILVGAFSFTDRLFVLSLAGIIMSLTSWFSIGRTVSFQKHWKNRLLELSDDKSADDFPIFPTFEEKSQFTLMGRISAKYVLLFPPFLFILFWIYIAITEFNKLNFIGSI